MLQSNMKMVFDELKYIIESNYDELLEYLLTRRKKKADKTN